MPRARNKAELLEFGQREYERLMDMLDGLSESLRSQTPVFDNRTIKDILAHLHAWHNMMLDWYRVGMAGEKPQIPAPGYSFKDTPALNEALYQQDKDKSWDEVLAGFQRGHKEVMALVEAHSDDELTAKQLYAWTGSTNLASYLASATSSHYIWASDLIKKFKKANGLS